MVTVYFKVSDPQASEVLHVISINFDCQILNTKNAIISKSLGNPRYFLVYCAHCRTANLLVDFIIFCQNSPLILM